MYCGTKQPGPIDRVLLQAHARLHWLRIETMQNIHAIAQRDEKNARG